ncbi:MAG: M23 family metallopeptidase, partial [Anaerolineaceae bacterium]
LGALDFAPPTMTSGCIPSSEWVTAVASGVVTRSYNGAVVVDLDGDGYEQTGWSIFYMHISYDGRVKAGDWVDVGDRIGHPSCEGGVSTGTHLHIARKYNGEWVPADGPLAFTLGGWTAHNGEAAYLGTLTRGNLVITSDVNSSYISKVTREK